MIKIPQISKVLQKNHEGQSVAIVDDKIVAFGKDSQRAEINAKKKGYQSEDIMTTFIMGKKHYAL